LQIIYYLLIIYLYWIKN